MAECAWVCVCVSACLFTHNSNECIRSQDALGPIRPTVERCYVEDAEAKMMREENEIKEKK